MTSAVISISVVTLIVASITVSVVAFFNTQKHRADAKVLVEYRQLAERHAAGQQELRDQLAELNERLKAVETLLRSVD
ncbi:hypothetical protein [Goodfellowiella coeruleoviolacea]|uniref:Uncharacterized protein n=1 Tax=Goodfellowiella coeruleoviolacea TaxID=334858 RepID=A0AAE3GKG9_9PSEU|nr:hypothetical protein [Goodfellowiella coeruleoviolacea]MCP2169263.1 hypothetical protein [Goodfellowiella coeruleoviolacea]